MKSDRINYLLVGVFVASMLAASLYVLELITGTDGPTDDYYVTYQNVTGLSRGAVVSFEGYPVGKVAAIKPDFAPGNVSYRVTLAIHRGWPIPDDSIARLASSGLIAALAVDISEGQSAQLLAAGAELKGREQANLFAVVDDVAAEFRSLTQDGIKPALGVVTAQVERLVTEIADLSTQELRPLLANGRERIEDLSAVFDESQAVLQSLGRVTAGLEKVLGASNQAHVTNSLVELSTAAQRLNVLMADLGKTRQGMDAVLKEARDLLATNSTGLHQAVDGFAGAAGDLEVVTGSLADRMDNIVHNLDGTARHLNEFARQLREQPGLLFSGSAKSEEGAEPR